LKIDDGNQIETRDIAGTKRQLCAPVLGGCKYNACILIRSYVFLQKQTDETYSVADTILMKDYHNVQLVQTYGKEIRLASLSTTFNGMEYEYHINENRLRSL
jgi:hypothetical protein